MVKEFVFKICIFLWTVQVIQSGNFSPKQDDPIACKEGDFRCLDGKKCIPFHIFCDERAHCDDGSDEVLYNASIHTADDGVPCRGYEDLTRVCLLHNSVAEREEHICNKKRECLGGFFTCSDKSRCVDKERYCDGNPDCSDGSDEIVYNASIHTEEDGYSCYMDEWQYPNCLLPVGGHPNPHDWCDPEVNCSPDEFLCEDGKQCIPKTRYCNLEKDCRDGSDEIVYDSSILKPNDHRVKCRSFAKVDHFCLLGGKFVFDEEDYCNLNDTPPVQVACKEGYFRCLDGKKCINFFDFCDERVHCEDGSDEILFDSAIHTPDNGVSCQNKFRDRFCLLPPDYDSSKHCFSIEFDCLPEWFICASGTQCVYKESFCDGNSYCRDGSDEVLYNISIHTADDGVPCRGYEDLTRVCLLHNSVADREQHICNKERECLVGYFRCSDKSKCVDKERYCDRYPDCSDGSDEIVYNASIHTEEDGYSCYMDEWQYPNCLLPVGGHPNPHNFCDPEAHCGSDGFLCEDGKQCIPKTQYCNLEKDCRDGSDEIVYDSSILKPNDHRVKCRSFAKVDHFCSLGGKFVFDEENYCNLKDTPPIQVACKEGYFRCWDGKKCIHFHNFCDERVHCDDRSDEILFDSEIHTPDNGVSCQNKYRDRFCFLPHEYDSSKYCFSIEFDCRPEWFVCASGTQCVHKEAFCDGQPYCRDGSDEVLYNDSIHTADDGVPCRGYRDLTRVCLLHNSVVDREEHICNKERECLVGNFRCSDKSECVNKERYCDRNPDCSDGSDEIVYDASIHTEEDGYSCYIGEWQYPNCLLPVGGHPKPHHFCDPEVECPYGFLCEDGKQCIPKTQYCNLERDCRDGSDEIVYNSSILKPNDHRVKCRSFAKFDHFCLLGGKFVFDEEDYCNLNDTPPIQVACKEGYFRCWDGKKCIDFHNFCDERVHCDDGSDEILFDSDIHTPDNGVSCQNKYRDRFCFLPHEYDSSKYCFSIEFDCRPEWFVCASGTQCVYKEVFCDGYSNCRDGSDEVLYKDSIHTAGVPCRGYQDLTRVCLLHNSVVGREEHICNKDRECPVGYFICSDKSRCVEKERFCDRNPDCSDGSDEIVYNASRFIQMKMGILVTWENGNIQIVYFP
ncbi:uncharacterized protein LOC120342772 [Styela clava]